MSDYILKKIKYVNSGCAECVFSPDANFYLRFQYLDNLSEDKFSEEAVFSEEEFSDCVQAGEAYAAERAALNYLSRNEHSRFLLKQKLLKKQFDASAIEKSLNYIEEKKWLSDERYAEAWLRCRSSTRHEGRLRLFRELMAHGVSKEVAEAALEQFFSERDEDEIFEKAFEKLVRQKKSGNALITTLVRLGFSHRMIMKKRDALNNINDIESS